MGLQRNIHSAVPTLRNADVSCLNENDSSMHKVMRLGSDTYMSFRLSDVVTQLKILVFERQVKVTTVR